MQDNEQRKQSKRSKQNEQSKQSEQSERYEQSRQREQYEQSKQSYNEQNEQNSYSEQIEQPMRVKPKCDYNLHFSDDGFWKKVTKHYRYAGAKLVKNVLTLYHSLRDEDTPKWAKTIIIGALGYFILPLDVVPDFVPIAGFTDDIAAVLVALAAVALYVKEEHKEKAEKTASKIFNE